MEIKLENGVVRENGLGLPEMLEGLEALLQQVTNRLNMLRGTFRYDRTMGSRIPEMTEPDAETVLRYAQEALLPCPEIEAEGVVLEENRAYVTVATPLGSGVVTVYWKEEEPNDDL